MQTVSCILYKWRVWLSPLCNFAQCTWEIVQKIVPCNFVRGFLYMARVIVSTVHLCSCELCKLWVWLCALCTCAQCTVHLGNCAKNCALQLCKRFSKHGQTLQLWAVQTVSLIVCTVHLKYYALQFCKRFLATLMARLIVSTVQIVSLIVCTVHNMFCTVQKIFCTVQKTFCTVQQIVIIVLNTLHCTSCMCAFVHCAKECSIVHCNYVVLHLLPCSWCSV